MAEKKNDQATATAKAAKASASVYTLKELAAASEKVFGTPSECVVAAMRLEGKTEATVEEAKAIVKKFMERKVK